jgi:membrane peptidoglycan carboxypeptidase
VTRRIVQRPPTGVTRTVLELISSLVLAGVLIAAMLVPFVGWAGIVARSAASRFLAEQCDFTETPVPQRSYLLARDGKTVIATLFAQNRAPVRLEDVPKPLVQALIATEDRRFYQHHGVDFRSLVRAAVHDASGDGGTQGGSTLTMQYVKQVRYYQAQNEAERAAAIDPNLDRKLQNAKCAIDLEQHNSKNQILEKYLNIAFFGENSYGVATAAETYFGVPVSRLTVPQAAMLVGLVRAPTLYDPFINPKTARDRRDEVLRNMAEVGDISAHEAADYMSQPLGLASSKPPPVREGCVYANPAVANAGFFCDYAVRWLTSHGFTEQTLDTAGLNIVTTLDARLQTAGQKAVWRGGLKANADYILVMPSVDPATGDVTTMISSRRFGVESADHGQSSEPLFTGAYAGAGSTYKYFTAAAALSAGAPTSLSLSTPGNTYTTRNCNSGKYQIRNAGDYPSTMQLADALPQSSNTYFVAMEDEFFGCKLSPIVDTALRLGMDRLNQPLNDTAAASIAKEVVRSEEPTFTLGQEPTSPLELTGAFSAAVNDGVFCPPAPILHVYSSTGAAMKVDRPACHRELSQYVARTVVTLMRADTHNGTARSYFGDWYAKNGSDVAGKTGTDNNAADNGNSALWFVGMTPHLVSAASLVNPQNPKQTVHDLPNLPGVSVGQDVFGAYASTYWLDAYGPTLARTHWSWPSAESLVGSAPPRVIGRSLENAKAALTDAGFRVSVFPVACGSPMYAGLVAYQQPPLAEPGSAVTICLSSGISPYVYTPPPQRTGPAPKPTKSHGPGHR